MNGGIKLAIGLVVVVVLAVGGWFGYQAYRNHAAPPPAPAAVAIPAPEAADCIQPGPVPVPPRGAVATAEEMKAGHDIMQGFVDALDAYQVCLENKIKNAPADTTVADKQKWRNMGNAAVDEAHLLANAFSQQIKEFKDRQTGAAVPPPAQ